MTLTIDTYTGMVNEHHHFLWTLVNCDDGKLMTITINAYMGMIYSHHYFPWIRVTHSDETLMTIIIVLYVVMLVCDKGSSPFILKQLKLLQSLRDSHSIINGNNHKSKH